MECEKYFESFRICQFSSVKYKHLYMAYSIGLKCMDEILYNKHNLTHNWIINTQYYINFIVCILQNIKILTHFSLLIKFFKK